MLRLYLIIRMYQEKKKNDKENDFFMFSYVIKKIGLCLILGKY